MIKLITTVLLTLFTLITNAQLKGSGIIITKTFDYQNFDKLDFKDLDGTIYVEIGKTWSIEVNIDDNLFPLLTFEEDKNENLLKIFFNGNRNNKKYIEDTNIKIKITMPESSVIKHSGNSKLIVSGLVGRYFRLENSSNGSATISGKIDQLDIVNKGNGVSNLKETVAKEAEIKCRGNGSVTVNVLEKLDATASGNGYVTNIGKAKFSPNSSSSGNGKLIVMWFFIIYELAEVVKKGFSVQLFFPIVIKNECNAIFTSHGLGFWTKTHVKKIYMLWVEITLWILKAFVDFY